MFRGSDRFMIRGPRGPRVVFVALAIAQLCIAVRATLYVSPSIGSDALSNACDSVASPCASVAGAAARTSADGSSRIVLLESVSAANSTSVLFPYSVAVSSAGGAGIAAAVLCAAPSSWQLAQRDGALRVTNMRFVGCGAAALAVRDASIALDGVSLLGSGVAVVHEVAPTAAGSVRSVELVSTVLAGTGAALTVNASSGVLLPNGQAVDGVDVNVTLVNVTVAGTDSPSGAVSVRAWSAGSSVDVRALVARDASTGGVQRLFAKSVHVCGGSVARLSAPRVRVVGASLANCSSLCDSVSLLATPGARLLSGGALFVDSSNVSVSGVSTQGNTLRSRACTAPYLRAGGGALFVVPPLWLYELASIPVQPASLSVDLTGCAFDGDAVLADSHTALEVMRVGGGAVYVMGVSVSVSASSFANLVVHSALAVSRLDDVVASGGGVFVAAPTFLPADVTLALADVTAARLLVNGSWSNSTGHMLVGGAAFGVLSPEGVSVTARNVTMSDVVTFAEDCSAQSGNGVYVGGAVLAFADGSVGVAFDGVRVLRASVYGDRCSTMSVSSAGKSVGNAVGGAVYANAENSYASASFRSCEFVGVAVFASALASLGDNFNGGAGVALTAGGDWATASITNCTFRDAAVVARGNRAPLHKNYNGGAGVYVYSQAEGTLSVTNSSFIGVSVFADDNSAQNNFNGGAGVYLFSKKSSLSATVSGCAFANATVAADRALNVINGTSSVDVVGNFNGGAGVFVKAKQDASLAVLSSRFANCTMSSVSSAALYASNYNGGAGAYVFAEEGGADVALVGVSLERLQVLATNASAFASNFNGGAAVYVTSIDAVASVQMNASRVSDSSVHADGAVAGVDNLSGGGALYLRAQTATAGFTAANSMFEACSVRATNGVAQRNSVAGGGAVYVLSEMEPNVTVAASPIVLDNVTLASVSVDAHGASAGASVANGGGAIIVNEPVSVRVIVQNCTVDTVVSEVSRSAGVQSMTSGGALYIVAESALVQLSALRVANAFLDGSRCSVNGTLRHADDETFDVIMGGAAVYVSAWYSTEVALVDAVLRNVSVVASSVSVARGAAYVGGAVFALSRAGVASVNATSVDAANASLVLAQVSGSWASNASTARVLGGACGGSVLYAIGFDALVRVTASMFATSSLQASGLASLVGAWYVGGGAVMAVGKFSSASLSVQSTVVVGVRASIASVSSAGLIVLGGGALLGAGESEAVVRVAESVLLGNLLSCADVNATSDVAVAGGGAVALATFDQCQASTVVLELFGNAVEGNKAMLAAVLGAKVVAAGGAVLASSSFSKESISVRGGSTFVGNVLAVQLPPALLAMSAPPDQSIGGGALAVRSSSLRSEGSSVVLSQASFVANVLCVGWFDGGGGGSDDIVQDASGDSDRDTFTANAFGGAALLFEVEQGVELRDVRVIGNRVDSALLAISGGGALFAGPALAVSVVFANNSAPSGAGLAAQGNLQLLNATIEFNVASVSGGGCAFAAGRSSLSGCALRGNIAGAYGNGSDPAEPGFGGGLAVTQTASVFVSGCTLDDNVALSAGGGALVVDLGALHVGNSTVFRGNLAVRAVGGAILTQLHARVVLRDTLIERSACGQSGGAVVLYDATVAVMERVTIRDSVAEEGAGCVLAYDSIRLSMSGVVLERCVALGNNGGVGGGLLVDVSAMVTLSNGSLVQNCSAPQSGGGGIAVRSSGTLSAASAVVQGCASEDGAAVALYDYAAFSADDLLLRGNNASSRGGAVLVACTACVPVLRRVNVTGNWAARGGAVAYATTNERALLAALRALTQQTAARTVLLAANRAVLVPGYDAGAGGGGAVLMDLTAIEPPPTNRSDTAFVMALVGANAALVAAIDDSVAAAYAPPNVAEAYGPVTATSLVDVRLVVEVVPVQTPLGARAVTAYPGATGRCSVAAIDCFAQAMPSLQAALVRVKCTGCTPVRQIITMVDGANNATVTLSGTPGQTDVIAGLPVGAFYVLPDSSLWQQSLTLGVCPPGFGYTESLQLCASCDTGLYALNGTGACHSCPENAFCLGGDLVLVANGYWPLYNASDDELTPVQCPYNYCDNRTLPAGIAPRSDLAGASGLNLSLACNPTLHRNGSSALCGRCVAGYDEWDRTCVACQPGEYNSDLVAIRVLQMLGYVLLQIVLAQAGSASAAKIAGGAAGAHDDDADAASDPVKRARLARRPWYERCRLEGGGSGFKLLVFVFQTAGLAVYPSLLLPAVLSVFDLDPPTATDRRCPFYLGSAYGELAVQLLSPVAYIVLLLAVFGVHRLVAWVLQRDRCLPERALPLRIVLLVVLTSSTDAYVRAILVLSINLYETVAQALFSFLACEHTLQVVYTYPSVSCSDEFYGVVQIVVIALLALIVASPVGMAFVLAYQRHKHHGSLAHLRVRFGPLFAEYRGAFFWWETYSLVRRALLLMIFVPFVSSGDLSAARLGLLLAVAAFALLQFTVRPYEHMLDNGLELFALIAIMSLIGVYATSNLPGETRIVIGTVVLIVSAVVLLAPTVWSVFLKLVETIVHARQAADSKRVQPLRARRRRGGPSESGAASDLSVPLALDDAGGDVPPVRLARRPTTGDSGLVRSIDEVESF